METLIKKEIGFKGQRALVLPPTVIKTMENNPLSAILHITDIGFYPKAFYHYCEPNISSSRQANLMLMAQTNTIRGQSIGYISKESSHPTSYLTSKSQSKSNQASIREFMQGMNCLKRYCAFWKWDIVTTICCWLVPPFIIT